MKRKIALVLATLLTLTVLLTTQNFAPTTTASASPTTVYIDPPSVTVYVCSNFTVDVKVREVTDLYAWQFNMTFDPNLLTCLKVTEGPFLMNQGSTIFLPIINNTAGWIWAWCSLLLPPPGASGSGTLAYVAFHCKGSGSCALHFITRDTFLFDSTGFPIPCVINDGSVTQLVYHWKIELAQKKCNAFIYGWLTYLGKRIPGTEFELNCTCTGAVFWKVATEVIPTDIHFEKYIDWNKDGIWDWYEVVDEILTQPTECHRWYHHQQELKMVLETTYVDLSAPIGSEWHEIYPVPSQWYLLNSWEDGGWPYGQLSISDQVDTVQTVPPTGAKDWWHVKNLTIMPPMGAQMLLNKLVVVEVYEQPYDEHDPFFYWQLTIKQHECAAGWEGFLTNDIGDPIPETHFVILCNCTQIQCDVVQTPYCTVPKDILFILLIDWDKDGVYDSLIGPVHVWITQFPWTWVEYGPFPKYVELELTEVQMHRYWVMEGETTSSGHLAGMNPWFENDPSSYPVPFATRKPWLTPMLMCQNITFTQKDPITGIVKLGVPAESYVGLNHTYWSPRIMAYVRVQVFLEEQGCGWLFTGEGKEPVLGSVDYRVFNNNTGVYSFGPDGVAGTADDELLAGMLPNPNPPPPLHAAGAGPPLGPCLQDLRGPDGIPCTGDDPLGRADPDGPNKNGSSILFLPTTMRVTYWNGMAWVLLLESPWPLLLTTGTAYDKVIEPASAINGVEASRTGQPWEFLAGLDHPGESVHWKDSHCNAYVKYVCVWSVLDVATAMGNLDVHFKVVEKKVREYWVDTPPTGLVPGYYVIPDINCDETVDIFDVVVCAATFGQEDEGFGRPQARRRDPPGPPYFFDARGDLRPEIGYIDIFDFVVIAAWFGYRLTNRCVIPP